MENSYYYGRWIDENGRVFICFTPDEIHDQPGIYRRKKTKQLSVIFFAGITITV